MTTVDKINAVCTNMAHFLTQKNKDYGDSALDPLHVFAKKGDGIAFRLDDKLARIKNSEVLRKNDVVDLTGYLILYMIEHDWLTMGDVE